MSSFALTERTNIQKVLSILLRYSGGISGTELARRLKIPPPTINRLVSGNVTDPRSSTLLMIAEYFEITVDQLLGKTPLPLHYNSSQGAFLLRPPASIPLYSFQKYVDKKSAPERWFKWAADENTYNAFALEIDTSKFEPNFAKGTTLIIDPNTSLNDNDYVVVELLSTNTLTIKKYLLEGTHTYFYPLLEGVKILMADEIQHNIIGVILEAHQSLRSLR